MPAQVDAMEIWQLASVLGMANPEQAEPEKRDITAERVAAAKGKGPKPKPRRGNADALTQRGVSGAAVRNSRPGHK